MRQLERSGWNIPLGVRYSPEVLTYFRSTGDGWQTHMDTALRLLVQKHPDWLKKLG